MSFLKHTMLKAVSLLLTISLVTGCSKSTQQQGPVTIRKSAHPSSITLNLDSPRQKIRPLILIDPGHGGRDLGASSPHKQPILEKNLALKTSKELAHALKKAGYRVAMTRTNDTFIELQDRTHHANSIEADLFISVHFNGAKNPKAHGLEVYFYTDKADTSRRVSSKRLGKDCVDTLAQNLRMKKRGLKEGNFHVIRETSMPAILIEGGFVSHAQEAVRIDTPQYRKVYAGSVVDAVNRYFRTSTQ